METAAYGITARLVQVAAPRYRGSPHIMRPDTCAHTHIEFLSISLLLFLKKKLNFKKERRAIFWK
jgi:hypothetical protein